MQQQQRDPMAELSEEQREEINEAVCIAPSVCLYALEVQERLPMSLDQGHAMHQETVDPNPPPPTSPS
jgi:hypothetical protein